MMKRKRLLILKKEGMEKAESAREEKPVKEKFLYIPITPARLSE